MACRALRVNRVRRLQQCIVLIFIGSTLPFTVCERISSSRLSKRRLNPPTFWHHFWGSRCELHLSERQGDSDVAVIVSMRRASPPRGGFPHRVPRTPLFSFRNSDPANGKEVLIALYAYESRAEGDLSFRKGDIMYLLDQRYALFSSFDDRSARS